MAIDPNERVHHATRDIKDTISEGMNTVNLLAYPFKKAGEVFSHVVDNSAELFDKVHQSNPYLKEIQESRRTKIQAFKDKVSKAVEPIETKVKESLNGAAKRIETTYGIPQETTAQFYSDVAVIGTAIVTRGIGKKKTLKSNERVDYSKGYKESVKNFVNEPKEFDGTFSKEVVFVRYHGVETAAHAGKWWMPSTQANKLSTMDEIMDRSALLTKYSDYSHVSVMRIPENTPVRFLWGKAKEQSDSIKKEYRTGGGVQYRFYDVDPKWVSETRALPVKKISNGFFFDSQKLSDDLSQHSKVLHEALLPRIEMSRKIAEYEQNPQTNKHLREEIQNRRDSLNDYALTYGVVSDGFDALSAAAYFAGNSLTANSITRFGQGALHLLDQLHGLSIMPQATSVVANTSSTVFLAAVHPAIGITSAMAMILSAFDEPEDNGMQLVIDTLQEVHQSLSIQISYSLDTLLNRFDRAELTAERRHKHLLKCFETSVKEIRDFKKAFFRKMSCIESDLKFLHQTTNVKLDAVLLEKFKTSCNNIKEYPTRFGSLSEMPFKAFTKNAQILENAILGNVHSHRNFNGRLCGYDSASRLNEIFEAVDHNSLWGYLAVFVKEILKIPLPSELDIEALPNINILLLANDHYLTLRNAQPSLNYDRDAVQISKIIAVNENALKFVTSISSKIFESLLERYENALNAVKNLAKQAVEDRAKILSNDILEYAKGLNQQIYSSIGGPSTSPYGVLNPLHNVYYTFIHHHKIALNNFRNQIESTNHLYIDISRPPMENTPSSAFLNPFVIATQNQPCKFNFIPFAATTTLVHSNDIPPEFIYAEKLGLGRVEFSYRVDHVRYTNDSHFAYMKLSIQSLYKDKEGSIVPITQKTMECHSFPDSRTWVQETGFLESTAQDRGLIALSDALANGSITSRFLDFNLGKNKQIISEKINATLVQLRKDVTLDLLDTSKEIGINFNNELDHLEASRVLIESFGSLIGFGKPQEEILKSLWSKQLVHDEMANYLKDGTIETPMQHQKEIKFTQTKVEILEAIRTKRATFKNPSIEHIKYQLTQLESLYLKVRDQPQLERKSLKKDKELNLFEIIKQQQETINQLNLAVQDNQKLLRLLSTHLNP